MKALLIVLLTIIMLLAIGGGCYAHYHNSEVGLRKQIEAQQEVCKSSFDKTWKIINQQAQVADRYKEAFADIYPQLMEGRYGSARGGALLSFITEHNPDFDIRLFDRLASSIEAQRTSFHRDQQMLIDKKRQHDTLLESFPAMLVVGSRSQVEIQVITSRQTQTTYETGQENNVDLFGPDN